MNCNILIGKGLRDKCMIDSWLMSAYINIIGKCNFRCVYCSADDIMAKSTTMTVEDIKKIIIMLKGKHVCRINVTGGEPFLHEYIEEIIQILMRDFSVSLLTNGTLITKHSQFLSKMPKKQRVHFLVSLDASSQRLNGLTRDDESFLEVIDGIKFLVKQGFDVNIMCTLTKYNSGEDEILNLVKLAKKLRVNHVGFFPVQPAGLGKKVFEYLHPDKDCLEKLLQKLPQISAEYQINLGLGYEKCYDEKLQGSARTLLPCKAGITQISIHNNGDVFPCNTLNLLMGNVFESSLDYILNESEGAKQIRLLSKSTMVRNPLCRDCKYINNCNGGCRAIAYGYSGDLYAPSYYCGQCGDSL